MRRNFSNQGKFNNFLAGVTASAIHKKYKVQSPVLRVMNSTGLAPSLSRIVNTTKRKNGSSARIKIRPLSHETCFCESAISKKLFQIHTRVQRSDFAVTIKHQRLTFTGKQTIFTK